MIKISNKIHVYQFINYLAKYIYYMFYNIKQNFFYTNFLSAKSLIFYIITNIYFIFFYIICKLIHIT